MRTIQLSAAAAHHTHLRLFLIACWLLSFTSLSEPGRVAPLSVGALDPIALAKIAARGTAFLLLAFIVISNLRNARGTVVGQRLMPLYLFAAWAVASIYWSPMWEVTTGHSVELLMLVILSTVAGLLSIEEQDCSRIFFHLTVLATALTLIVVLLDLRAILSGERPVGYMQPNDLAKNAGAGLLLLCCCNRLWKWRWTQRLFVPVLLVLAFALFAARSRTAVILTPVPALMILWRFGTKIKFVIAACAVCGILALLAPYNETVEHLPKFLDSYIARGQTANELKGLSGRAEMWEIAIESFEQSPFFGHGYYVMSGTGVVRVWGKDQFQTAHNAFLHVITGLGIIGMTFFLWGLASVTQPSLVALRDVGRTFKPEFVAFVIIGWYCTMGLFEIAFFGPVDASVVIFFALIGISAGFVRRPR